LQQARGPISETYRSRIDASTSNASFGNINSPFVELVLGQRSEMVNHVRPTGCPALTFLMNTWQ